jgi:hypothetical protein
LRYSDGLLGAQRGNSHDNPVRLEASELVANLTAHFGIDKLTSISTEKARIDFTKATLKFAGKEYKLSPVGTAAQELVLTEGLENWRKERL